MIDVEERLAGDDPAPEFAERYVEADGFRVRYCEAGQGQPVISLHGAGGLHIYRSHELLAEHRRVIVFEVPGFGESPANERSGSMQDLALTMGHAVSNLGIERFNLMGNSFGGKLALWLAVQQPERIQALVLIAPAAIRPEGSLPPQGISAEERRRLLYAHPERLRPTPEADRSTVAKQQELVRRVIGPARDEELESRMAELPVPVLVLFGTEDRMMPPEMGRLYREKLPNCHFVLVYDAAHEVDADRPEAFVSLVTDFFERHEGFIVNRKSGLIHP